MIPEKANSAQSREPWYRSTPNIPIIINQNPPISGMGGIPVERQRRAQTLAEMLENEGLILDSKTRERLIEARDRWAVLTQGKSILRAIIADASAPPRQLGRGEPNRTSDSRLDSLSAVGLNGPRQPNDLAVDRAAVCLNIAKTMGIDVSHVTTSAIGGIALTFANGPRIAMLECDNDGDIVAMLSDRAVDQDAETWILDSDIDTSIPIALRRIQAFVGEKTGATAS
jgi:hypothetical protein